MKQRNIWGQRKNCSLKALAYGKARGVFTLTPIILAVVTAPAYAADTLVREGTKATLSVDYVYESKG